MPLLTPITPSPHRTRVYSKALLELCLLHRREMIDTNIKFMAFRKSSYTLHSISTASVYLLKKKVVQCHETRPVDMPGTHCMRRAWFLNRNCLNATIYMVFLVYRVPPKMPHYLK